MALSPISYLDSWLHSPGPSGCPDHASDSDEDGNNAYQDLPEESISSSFPSVLSHPSHGNRNENPGSRPGWNDAVEEAASRDTGIRQVMESEPASIVPEETEWLLSDSTLEVGRGRRIGICNISYTFLKHADLNSTDLHSSHILLPISRNNLRLRGHKTSPG